MNKFLRVLFILVIVAMLGASVLQIFLPSYMGEHSGYGISAGWQREIGIWNLAVLIIILAVNIKYDWFYLRIALLAVIQFFIASFTGSPPGWKVSGKK